MITGKLKELNDILNKVVIICFALLLLTGIVKILEMYIVPTNISSVIVGTSFLIILLIIIIVAQKYSNNFIFKYFTSHIPN